MLETRPAHKGKRALKAEAESHPPRRPDSILKLLFNVCPLVDKNFTDFDAQVVAATNKQTRTTDRPGMGRAEPRLQASKPTEGLTQRDTCSERSKTYPYPRGLAEPEILNFGGCERPPSIYRKAH